MNGPNGPNGPNGSSRRNGRNGKPWFACAAIILVLLALAHVGAIFGGAAWYAFLGAPDSLVQMARAGKRDPDVSAALIALVCLLWAAYALSGAGLVKRLPLLRTALVMIAAGMFVRAAGFIAVLAVSPHALDFLCNCNGINTMVVVTSAICLVIAACIAFGLYRGVSDYASGTPLSNNRAAAGRQAG